MNKEHVTYAYGMLECKRCGRRRYWDDEIGALEMAEWLIAYYLEHLSCEQTEATNES